MSKESSRARSILSALLSAWLAAAALPAQAQDPVARQVGRLLSQHKAAEALALLDPALAASPADLQLLMQRVAARSMTGDFEGAITDATAAIPLAPKDWRPLYERGFARFRLQQYRQALADYDAAVALAPRIASLHGERGDVLLQLDQPVEAKAAFTRAVALAPQWAQAWSGRGSALRQLADFAAACSDLRRASELQPDDPGIWYQLCCVAFDSRDDATAVAAGAEWLRRLLPAQRPMALEMLGRMHWRLGDDRTAIAKLREGIAAGGDGASRIWLALTCVQLGAGDLGAAGEAVAAATRGADPSLQPWVALMQWCVTARSKGLDEAGKELVKTAAAMPEATPQFRQLVALCARGEGADGDDGALREDLQRACPLLFFAGWRASCRGDEALTQRLLRRAVNTGARDWLQWALAVRLLRGRPGGEPSRPTLGAQLAFDVPDKAGCAVVQSVEVDGAASWQGLRVGDEIVELAGAPITRAAWEAIDQRAREGLDLRLSIRRGGESHVLYVRLGAAD